LAAAWQQKSGEGEKKITERIAALRSPTDQWSSAEADV
jgi:hypothetical protein